ncbi:MAG: histidine phosphatase family protein [Bdellovibrionia bacterium]
MIKRVYIFRHGETDWNREGRFQGHLDVPINETGRRQAIELVSRLDGSGIEAILSSDLSRAYETARIVANQLGIPVFSHEGLREAHLGEAQGLVREEIERRFGTEIATKWRSNQISDADICYPGGETGAAIMKRVFDAMEAFLHDRAYENVAISTHGGVIRRVMQRLLPPGSEMVPIPNTVLYLLTYDLKERRWRSA